MKTKYYISIAFLALLLVVGCSTKKDKAINRGFHSLNTKYNVLYNGEVAFQDAVTQLNSFYEDNYWERLPVEPLKIEELALPGAKGSEDKSNDLFDKAEEKSVKAIQKHSMNIAGKERNKQIDDAYLLLGKSRYYSQRFLPALEAFNYVIKHYPKADLITETKIWRAKTMIRLNNEETAIDVLEQVLKTKSLLDDRTKEMANTAMAMAYIEIDSIDSAVHYLKKAVYTKVDREQTARNWFILGQIYSEQGNQPAAEYAFNEILEMKRIPYKYQIHSEIELLRNLSDSTDMIAIHKKLNKLINDRYNRPYLDALFYEQGNLYESRGQLDLAKESFINSVHTDKAQKYQKSLSYEKVGNIYFDEASFVNAGAYYDSVMSVSEQLNTKRIRILKRKRNSLKEVIKNEQTAQLTDSILTVVAMSEDEQKAYFQEHIDELIAIKEAKEKAEAALNRGYVGVADPFASTALQASSGGKWYFYNKQLADFGARRFKQIWGDRALEDNWRVSSKKVTQQQLGVAEEELFEVEDVAESQKYDLEAYLSRIPKEQTEIDSISKLRNKAYYNLGLTYKEQFKEYELASERFEDLLSFKPAERYILPSKYHLFKIYEVLNSPKAKQYKDDIVANYSDTKYALLVTNPAAAVNFEDDNDPVKVYESVYAEYQDEKYDLVLTNTEKAINMYEGLPILPKFELLRAYTIGKTQGVEAFRTALEYVSLNYSNTEEGKKAAEVITSIKKLN